MANEQKPSILPGPSQKSRRTVVCISSPNQNLILTTRSKRRTRQSCNLVNSQMGRHWLWRMFRRYCFMQGVFRGHLLRRTISMQAVRPSIQSINVWNWRQGIQVDYRIRGRVFKFNTRTHVEYENVSPYIILCWRRKEIGGKVFWSIAG